MAERVVARLRRVSWRLCVAGVALGAFGLVGWLAGSELLPRFGVNRPPMMPNTALALIAVGGAAALRVRLGASPARRVGAQVVGLAVVALGAATLVEYVAGVDLGIDQFVNVSETGGPYPGRMSPPSAMALVCLGLAVAGFDLRVRRWRPAEGLAFIAGLIAVVALVGHALGAGVIYQLERTHVIGVALPTACALLVIAAGVIVARPEVGLMRLIVSTGPGGAVLRWLGVGMVAALVAVGWVVVRSAEAIGLVEVPLTFAIVTVATIPVGVGFLMIVAHRLDAEHQTLEAARQRTREMFEGASDGIFLADLDGRYTEVNRAACEITGWSRDELVGKSILDFIRPEDVDRLWQARDRLLQGGAGVAEWLFRHKDGRYISIEVSERILADGRWVGFVRDISERVRSQRHQRILADVGAVLASTLRGPALFDETARVVLPSLADWCALDLFDDHGHVCRAVRHRDSGMAEVAHRFEARGVDPSRPHLTSDTLRRARGTLVSHVTEAHLDSMCAGSDDRAAVVALGLTSIVAAPLVVRDRVLGAIAFASSTPDRRFVGADRELAEEIARRLAMALENAWLYDAAQKAIRDRDELVGIVAHDLRSPLGAALLGVQVLLDRDPARDRRQATRKVAERCERSLRRAGRLLDDLLDVARIERGALTVAPEPTAAAGLAEEVVEALAPAAARDGVALALHAERELPAVRADGGRVHQVLSNLIENALKFTPAGGRIDVRVARDREHVRYEVADTGAGIAPEHLAHVFDRYWQGQRTDRRGVGLGLPVSKGIVEAHGGRIWIDSAPGVGTTVRFTLPIAAEVGRAAAAAVPAATAP